MPAKGGQAGQVIAEAKQKSDRVAALETKLKTRTGVISLVFSRHGPGRMAAKVQSEHAPMRVSFRFLLRSDVLADK